MHISTGRRDSANTKRVHAMPQASRPKRTKRRRRVRNAEGPPKILALLAACPLYPPPVEGRCGACGEPLSGRRTRWCSRACAASWRTNHIWTYARRAARTRDRNTCKECGTKRPSKPSRRHVTGEAYAIARAAYDAVPMEVNHRVALDGVLRSHAGCAHHLENLETLCAPCHKRRTAAQATARAAARRAAKALATLALAA
jgi:5-methylcytosine-specific restriction endonuclease McrA